MEDQVPSSNIPGQMPEQQSVQPAITAEQFQEMKRVALENAIRQQQEYQQQQQQAFNQQVIARQQAATLGNQKIIRERRGLTVAELLLILALSYGIVTGIQITWNFFADLLPRIEIREK